MSLFTTTESASSTVTRTIPSSVSTSSIYTRRPEVYNGPNRGGGPSTSSTIFYVGISIAVLFFVGFCTVCCLCYRYRMGSWSLRRLWGRIRGREQGPARPTPEGANAAGGTTNQGGAIRLDHITEFYAPAGSADPVAQRGQAASEFYAPAVEQGPGVTGAKFR